MPEETRERWKQAWKRLFSYVNRMELAVRWHRRQNLLKKVTTSLLYRERNDPVKDGLANAGLFNSHVGADQIQPNTHQLKERMSLF